MTPQRAQKLLHIIKAFAKGKQIQCRCIEEDGVWEDTPSPGWSDAYEYRIKPGVKRGWVNIYPSKGGLHPILYMAVVGKTSSTIYKTKDDADKVALDDRIACVEITWEEK